MIMIHTVLWIVFSAIPVHYCSMDQLLDDEYFLPKDENDTLIRDSRATGDDSSTNNIEFDVPDLNVLHNVNGIDVELQAYKVRGRNNRWVSIGQPFFLKNQNGSIYDLTPDGITMHLRLLANDQAEALKKIAKAFDASVEQAFITLVPLQSLNCRTSFQMRDDVIELHAEAQNLNQYVIPVEMSCQENSKQCKAFYQRIKRLDPLKWTCTFTAAGKQVFVNRLQISGEDLQDAAIDHDLFGPADQVYVTRKQLTKFAQNIRTNLLIEEDYELDEKFDEKLVERLSSIAMGSFEYVPIDQVLDKLSNFGFSMSERDLEPDEIKRQLADIMVINKQDAKKSTSLKIDDKQLVDGSDEYEGKGRGKFSWLSLFDAEADGEVLKKKSRKWNWENMSVEDAVDEMNRDNQLNVKFETDGSVIKIKALKVALLHKNMFKRNISIMYRKKVYKDSLYKKNIALTSDLFGGGTTLAKQLTDKIEHMAQRYHRLETLIVDAEARLQNRLSNSITMLQNSDAELTNKLERHARRSVVWDLKPASFEAPKILGGTAQCKDGQFIFAIQVSEDETKIQGIFCVAPRLE